MSLRLHFIIVSVSFQEKIKIVREVGRAKRLVTVLATKGVLRVNQLGAYGEIMIKLI